MTKYIAVILILLSSAASVYYSINGTVNPESMAVYNKASMSRVGIRLLSVLLGVGGLLILLPQTFRIGGSLLIAHSLITIACFATIRDWKGGGLEVVFLQVPIFLVWVGYPSTVLDRIKTLLY